MITDSLTDPKSHNPDEYLYIAHSVDGFHTEFDAFNVRQVMEHLTTPDTYFSVSLIGKSEGELVEQFGWKHLDSFDQTVGHTFVGFLLQPDEIKIPIAWNCDLGSPRSQSELKEFVQEHWGKKRSLYQLITESVGSGREFPYNELIVEGSPGSIVGVYYFDIHGQMSFEEQGEKLHGITKQLGYDLPLIEIVHEPVGIIILGQE